MVSLDGSINIVLANGVEGELVVHDGHAFLRVDGVDFRVEHLNLRVKVIDEDAAFYTPNYTLDHHPDSMGIRYETTVPTTSRPNSTRREV